MSVEGRRRIVRQHGYCGNCMARSHDTNECSSADVCQKCGWAHHTLLHADNRRNHQQTTDRPQHRQLTRHRRHTSSQPRRGQQQQRNQHVQRRQQSPSIQPSSQQPTRIQPQNQQPSRIQPQRSSREHRRPQSHSRQRRDSNRDSSTTFSSPRRILRGALRALTQLQKTL